ncbi:MAG: lamin tail domain-containing protein, partial [Planctomycetales bacterium]|nr:lamin tail domain-containing protein [Planctomycetales bacterium]
MKRFNIRRRKTPLAQFERLEPRRVLDSTVVFNEVMYHPSDSGDQQEWIELYNQMAVDVDISGWKLTNGVEYEFPAATRIRGRSYLVVAADPELLAEQSGIGNALGPFDGRLSNGGESLDLRNNSDRLMDRLDYGDNHPWPVTPDGSGATLAKAKPMSGSAHPENWTVSTHIGGTPGRANFAAFDPTIVQTPIIQFGAPWNVSATGIDLGESWRNIDFDDSHWSVGTAPFVAGRDNIDLTLPEPLTSIPNTGFDDDGELTAFGRREANWYITETGQNVRAITEHPAWLPNNENSSWISIERNGRRNVDPGQYSFSTDFDLSEWDASTASVEIRVAVDDALDDVLLNGNSTGISASGFAQMSGPFTVDSGFEPGMNTLTFVFTNGGETPNPSGLRVEIEGTAVPLQRGERIPDEPTTYYFRQPFVNDGHPNAEVSLLLDAFIDDGAVFYLNGKELFRRNMPAGPIGYSTPAESEVALAEPLGFTAVSAENLGPGTNVLAVEVHQAGDKGDDIQFDAALTVVATPIPPPPPPPNVVFNEMSAVGDDFWLELINLDDDAVDLGGFLITTSGQQTEYKLAETRLAPGEFLQINTSELGFQPGDGDHLFLYTPDRASVLDGQVATNRLRGRSSRHDGQWLFPANPTPAAENDFEFHDEIVINEIQYHARPTLAVPDIPPTISTTSLIGLNSTWLFDQSGRDLGPDWHTTTYAADGNNWTTGQAPIGFETGRSADLITTMVDDPRTVDPSVITYYFQTQFEFNGDLTQPDLQLHLGHLVDDGAVFYLNGVEIDRYNMPEGPIDSATLATDRVNNAVGVGPTYLPVDQLRAGTNVFSVEVHQDRASDRDIFFDVSLAFAEPSSPAIPGSPYVESQEEWIELYNRSDHTVDLSGWRLDDAIRFEFPVGTLIEPDAYLVVANDASRLREIYPQLSQIGGEFDGTLSNKSEQIILLDDSKNPADVVRYYDGENWPDMADGNGSTLELQDPDADNSRADAWSASDESAKTAWQRISYRSNSDPFPGTNDPDRWNEFIFGLLSAGEILIDDISVVEDPGGEAVQLIQNGTFDDGADHFRLVGNHGAHGLSKVVPDPDDPNNPVLHLVATGFSEHMSNHVETTFVDNRELAILKEYEVSYRVRWLTGSGQLNTRAYFNRMARTSILDVPQNIGTPGAPNSVRKANHGPTYQGLTHEPTIPQQDQDIQVSIQAQDPDGIKNLTLWYSADGGDWNAISMADRAKGDYSGIIPPHAAGTVIQFYVEGSDGDDVTSTFPAKGRDSRALFIVDDGRDLSTNQHSFRIVMTADDAAKQVVNTNVLSNHRLGATVITDDNVYYDVQARIKGSGFGRSGNQRGYNIRFQPDHLFRGVHDLISIDRKDNQTGQGASHRELVHKHIGAAAGDIPELYDDLIYIIPPDNSFIGPAQLQMSRYDNDFLDSSYENGSDGTRFEFELIYHSSATTPGRDVEGLKLPPSAVLGIDIEDLGDDKEAYRWNFLIKNHRLRDDFSRIIELGKTMSLRGSENGGELDLRSQDVMDVDAWLRTFAYMSLGGINDTYNQGLPHNLQLFVRPEDQRVVPLPWDQDFTFHHAPTLALLGSGSNLRNILRIPNNQHHFYGHMYDMISTTYNVEYLRPWIEHYANFVQFEETAAIEKYIEDRTAFVMRQLPDEVEFSVDTDEPIVVDETHTTLTGSGWIDVRDIRVRGADHSLEVVWQEDTRWQLQLPVAVGTNEITLEAVNLRGELIGSSTVNVTSTVSDRPLEQFLRVSEIMYNPPDPTNAEAAEGHNNNDDFEYVELVNIGTETIQLADARFVAVDGLGFGFDFATSVITELAPGETILVVENMAAFQTRYGNDLPVAGQWTGRLSNAGETITLQAGENIIQRFAFDDAWYPTTDGEGESLVIVNAAADLESWGQRDGWSSSGMVGGSPGRITGRPGDVNGDGVFDSSDLTAVLQAGEFEDGIDGNSTFAEGDWNGDG